MVRNYDISQFIIISAQKYDLQISFKKWFRIESQKMKSIIKIGVISIEIREWLHHYLHGRLFRQCVAVFT